MDKETIKALKAKLTVSKVPKPSEKQAYEDYCKMLSAIGGILLPKYFNNATDMIGTRPWGGVGGEVAYKSEYDKYKEGILSDDSPVKDRSSELWRGIKLASQEEWFKSESVDAAKLDYTMRNALVKMASGDAKKKIVTDFLALEDSARTVKALNEMIPKQRKRKTTTTEEAQPKGEKTIDAFKLVRHKELKQALKTIEDQEKELNKALDSVSKLAAKLQSVISTVKTELMGGVLASEVLNK